MTANKRNISSIAVDWLLNEIECPFSPYREPDLFIDFACAQTLPQELEQHLVRFREGSNREGVLYLKGLPIDPILPETPINGTETNKDTFLSEYTLALIASVLGAQVGYKQEKKGALFHQVTPGHKEESEQSSEGSRVRLELHTERTFHPYLPDYLLLYCLRPDPGGKGGTSFVGIREVLPLISDDLRKILFQSQYQTGIDYSFGNVSTEKANGPVLSVLYGEWDDPSVRYDLDLMAGLTEEAQQVLDKFTNLLTGNLHEVILQPGEMLILDNHKTVHGRNPFVPNYDGKDRWLQRIYAVKDLAPSANDRPDNKRVIATEF